MTEAIQAYCVKCKTKREMLNPEAVYTQTGTPGTKGTCPVCGTTLFRMGTTDAHANLPKPERTAAPIKKRAKSKKPAKNKKAAAKRSAKTPVSSNRRVGKLVIVESPAKARSVGNFLGSGYTVKASKGHVRDLLVTQLSVDVTKDFEPK